MTPLSQGEDRVSRRTRDGDIGWGLGGGGESMRSAEGLGDNKTTIQVVPFSEGKSDCDLLCWNQRNLFFIILLTVNQVLSVGLSIHYK